MPTASAIKRKKRRKSANLPARQPQVVTPLEAKPEVISAPPPDALLGLAQLRFAPAILLAFVTFAVYYPVLHNPFANYDDAEYVIENAYVHQGLKLSTLRWAITSTEHANWHPVTWISHAIDWQLFGGDPVGHHLTSLLLHIANVILLFFFLEWITRAKGRSLVVAALFAIHPLNVESVVWIAERKNVLSMLFFLGTLFAYAWFARRPSLWRYGLVGLTFLLGLAAKPMLVTVPLLLLLLDFWPLQRVQGWTEVSPTFPVPQAPLWRLGLEKLPLLLLSAGDCVLTMIAQKQATALRPTTKYALYDRVGNAIVSYAKYLWKLVWPTRLAVFYPHPAGHLRFWQIALCSLILAAASYWVWRERRTRPYLLMGWCWFLGTMVPVIGLVQVGDQGMANRYVYLPAIGIFILAAWGLAEFVPRIPARFLSYAGAGVGVALLLFSILAARQVRVWRSNDSLWGEVLAVDPNNVAAEDVVGSELLVKALNRGLPYSAEAMVHFQNALRIDPKDSEALLNVGADLQAHDKPSEAIEKFQLALANASDPIIKFRVLTDMGLAYEKLADFETSRRYYREALALDVKDDPTAFVGFARTFTDEQIRQLIKELSSQPTAPGYYKLGQLQEAGGYQQEAIRAYRQALQLDPKFATAGKALSRLEPAGP